MALKNSTLVIGILTWALLTACNGGSDGVTAQDTGRAEDASTTMDGGAESDGVTAQDSGGAEDGSYAQDSEEPKMQAPLWTEGLRATEPPRIPEC